MASLRELQRSFAAALRDPDLACAVTPRANLSVYGNNSASAFRAALRASFPVVRRRVGDEYFDQLVHHYRKAYPSRSGDLHFAGEQFARFLDEHLGAGEYGWLADLARLEWAREEALISPELPAVPAEVLARHAPEDLENLVFAFQPSLRLVSSAYPVFSVWLANQQENAPPVGQSVVAEAGLIRLRSEFLDIRPLSAPLFSYLYAMTQGAPLGEAVAAASLDEPGLLAALGFVFSEELVTAVALKSDPPGQAE